MDWLRQIPMGQYVDGSTGWMRRLDPRLKLAWSLLFLLTPVLAGPIWRLALVLVLLLLTLGSGLPVRLWWRSLMVLMLLAAAVGILSMLLPPLTLPPLWRCDRPMSFPEPLLRGRPGICCAWGPCRSGRLPLVPW